MLAPRAASVTRPGLGDVRFDSVSIQVTKISLEPCAEGESVPLVQGGSIDLFATRSRAARIPAGSYCSLLVETGGGGDSFAAERQVSNGQTTLTFESGLRARARLALLEPLLTYGERPSWILGVDLAAWLDPLSAWLGRGEPMLMLNDAETNALRRAQAQSLRLYEDVERDGKLGAEDIDAPLSEPGTLVRP